MENYSYGVGSQDSGFPSWGSDEAGVGVRHDTWVGGVSNILFLDLSGSYMTVKIR